MNKKNILLSWIGNQDFDDPARPAGAAYGAITSMLLWRDVDFQEAHLLSNRKTDEIPRYVDWLKEKLGIAGRQTKIHVYYHTQNTNPTDYRFIYEVAEAFIHQLEGEHNRLHLNLTSGTPAMSATWLLLGRGVYEAVLLQNSVQRGVEYIELPYDLSLQAKQDQKIALLSNQLTNTTAHFEHIPAQSVRMRQAVALAQLIAPRNVPVIIQGATGTGKEVIAQAIHAASPRQAGAFVAVNCGAIPESLIDAELFGHAKGAFTGANSERAGHFEAAHGGTLFLDELGELPMSAQVKLLRVLQQGEVVRLGESRPRRIDVRIIAATHRDLLQMIEEGRFREDLFYRLAVGLIHLPALRERKEDILALAAIMLDKINEEVKNDPLFVAKKLTIAAQRYIQQQSWQGNVRELGNTLLRAAVWNPQTPEISEESLKAAMIQRRYRDRESMPAPAVDLSEPVDLPALIQQLKQTYIKSALALTNGNKTLAARMLNIKSIQNLDNWLKS